MGSNLDRVRYRGLPELYREGIEVVLGDDLVIYMVALNPFERDEVVKDAATAKARMVLATKEYRGDEVERRRADFHTLPREFVESQLVDRGHTSYVMEAVRSVQIDPEWEERLEIMARGGDVDELDKDDPERRLVDDLTQQYMAEVQRRIVDQREMATERIKMVDEESLEERWVKSWLHEIGEAVAGRTYTLSEIKMAARTCAATPPGDGEDWNHGDCDAHRIHVFETVADVKGLADPVYEQLAEALAALNVPVTESKGSGSREDSSASSRLPSKPEGSPASTPEETSDDAPGISASP